MKITEVRIFPTESRDGKLKAFATMTFDDWFVVRNVKVIQGNSGLFVAMPSRKAMDICPKCRFKNVRGARYCNQCGAGIEDQELMSEDASGEKQAGHMDIAHPITQECRVYIQEEILNAYKSDKGEQTLERKGARSTSVDTPSQPKESFVETGNVSSEEEKTVVAETPMADDSQDIEL
ncbi:SpoVG family protein [Candidatus Omnitrophota bacterium]